MKETIRLKKGRSVYNWPGKEQGTDDIRETKYHGMAACLAIWKHRPKDIIRVYLEKQRLEELADLLKWAAAQRKAYHIVENDDLERLTETTHHQGVCVLARERPVMSFDNWIHHLAQDRADQLVVYLDGVENPHNLGAILRSCAHFGVRYLLGQEGRLPRLSPSACRVAEGGAELVDLVYLQRPVPQLRQLKELGFSLLTTVAAKGVPLYGYTFPPRTIVAMGAETQGVSAAIQQISDVSLCIPGTGRVESLNVSVAFAVMAGEYFRQCRMPAAQ